MLHARERWVQFHELVLGQEPQEAPNIYLQEIIPHFLKHIDNGYAYQLKNNARSAFRIQQYFVQKDEAIVLLFQYADKDATDPVFADLQTGDLRHEPKLQGEGIAVSAHAVIGLKHVEGKEDTHPFLLEVVPGLGRSSVGPFLKRQIKDSTEGLFDYIDEASHNSRTYKPSAEIMGKPSTSFVEELEEGVLSGIELINRIKSEDSFDEEGYFIVESKVMKVKVHRSVSGSKLLPSRIPSLLSLGRERGYDELRVRYKKKEGRQKSVVMGTSEDDLRDVLVVKDELIVSDVELLQCTPEINMQFARNMLKLLKA